MKEKFFLENRKIEYGKKNFINFSICVKIKTFGLNVLL
jgi:hypothetical protein